jgi:hypothetical protein
MSVLRMTAEQYAALLERQKAAAPEAVVKVSPKSAKPAEAAPTPLQRMQALGRLKTGEMNGTESAYEKVLAEHKRAGEVIWYAFEAITFVLPGGVRYTPDFVVQLASGEIEIHEVKGHWQEDARQKIKIAQGVFPFRFLAIVGKKKKGVYTWTVEDFWK